MRFSDLTSRIFGRSREYTHSQTFRPSSVRLYGYDDILLKDFIEICRTGNLSPLVITGSPTSEEISDAWEKIVEENSRHNGDNQYSSFLQLNKSAGEIEAEFTIIETSLTILWYKFDWSIIQDLRSRGYEVVTTAASELTASKAYEKSILSLRHKITHLKTRAEKRRREIERRFGSKSKDSPATFYDCIGNLELALGWGIPDAEKMTLARYNALKKGARERHRAAETAHNAQKKQRHGRNR